jgi:hypothetical protein
VLTTALVASLGFLPMALATGAGSNVSVCQWLEEGLAYNGGVIANMSCGPLSSFKLILNGQDRFKEQSGKYFNQVEPFMHHTGKIGRASCRERV